MDMDLDLSDISNSEIINQLVNAISNHNDIGHSDPNNTKNTNDIVIEEITNDVNTENTETTEFVTDPEVINIKKARNSKNKTKSRFRVGIVDDVRCELHVQEPGHQESPDRIKAIRQELKDSGTYDKLILIEPIDIDDNDLHLAHTNKYVNKVIRTCTKYGKAMIDCDDVRVNGSNSLVSAGVAVGGVMAAVNAVINPKSRDNIVTKVFCNIRPPGHHASQKKGAGFCIFNNVAIGARYALSYTGIDRVLIIDWDLHHGDGTQSIFKNSKGIMYASFHRAAPFYPNSGSYIFKGKYGNIHNYPQNPDVTIEEYMRDFYNMLKKAEAFNPDLIFISAGFDSHKDDLYQALPIDYEHFDIMTEDICILANKVCGGKVISVLEGGYTTSVLSECVNRHINKMLDNN